MTEYLEIDGGRLAYDVAGQGPLVVLAHGIGDSRAAYRFLAPELVKAGYRTATVDIRGCGESTADWPSYTRTAIAGDLVALVRHLGGPAVLVGHSISGGAVTIAAAKRSELVLGVVELAPFTRAQQMKLADFRQTAYRRGTLRLFGTFLLGSARQWMRYIDLAYPGVKPSDWSAFTSAMAAKLRDPERMTAMKKMGFGSPKDAGEQLAHVTRPVLVIEGSRDPDWASPAAEGEAVVAALPEGVGRLAVIEGAGHYPHAQYPRETLELMLPFLAAAVEREGEQRA